MPDFQDKIFKINSINPDSDQKKPLGTVYAKGLFLSKRRRLRLNSEVYLISMMTYSVSISSHKFLIG
ncbi:hypothetical protein BGP_3729 [Beggiatoa sp. PS]|nr:hypothetical protein BGP_3729 [Beggiatoa sp. PS]